MDSESQEPIQEHIPQTEEDNETPSTGDNLPTKPEQEDDRGVVSNSTFHIAGQPHIGIIATGLLCLPFCCRANGRS